MLLEVSGLSVHFGGVKAVDDVSFHVDTKEILSIIGPNGAGKTTIFNLVSRIYDATAGQIEYDGESIIKLPPSRIAGLGIARTFQNIELFEHASVIDNLLLGCHCMRKTNFIEEALFLPKTRAQEHLFRDRVEEVIEFLELEHYREAPVAELPYGVRKIVELGRALALGPKLLLLDEPSSGLNPEETRDMAFWIRDLRSKLGITVLLVEHDMGLVGRVSDRVLVMESGKVLTAGTPQEVLADERVVAAYLGS